MTNSSERNKELPFLFKDEWGKEWLVDKNTGEMSRKSRTIKHPVPTDLYYGIDTKQISECNTEDQLLEVVSMLDAYTDTKVYVNHAFLTESVVSGFISPLQLKLLYHIVNNLCIWNIYLGNREHLLKSGVDSKSLTKTLRALEQFIRIESTDIPYKTDYRISINPYVAWKGDRRWQEHYKNKWYGVNGDGIEIFSA